MDAKIDWLIKTVKELKGNSI